MSYWPRRGWFSGFKTRLSPGAHLEQRRSVFHKQLELEEPVAAVCRLPKEHWGKILFIATVYTHLAAFHIPFMRLLQDKGYEVHAAASPAGGRKAEVEEAGVRCWEVPFVRSPYSPGNLAAYRALKALLARERFALIHVHTPVAAFLGRYLGKVTKQGPVIYTAHGFHFYQGAPLRNWLLYYLAERIAARWTDGLIVINHEDLENAQRLGFKLGEDLFFVHGVGVDLEQYSCRRAGGRTQYALRAGTGAEDMLVTCVAEFDDNKNHAFLLAAWAELALVNSKAHLLLVGDGELRPLLLARAEKGRIPRVHFVDFRPDVLEILRQTDVVTLVSKREGLPRSIMEAMAAGKPVVATNVRGSRDLVEDGITGFLVEPGDKAGFKDALAKLLAERALRERMGRAGQDRIREYALERVLVEMGAVYARYLSGW